MSFEYAIGRLHQLVTEFMAPVLGNSIRFYINSHHVGFVLADSEFLLTNYPDFFLQENKLILKIHDNFDFISNFFDHVAQYCKEQGLTNYLQEDILVRDLSNQQHICKINRGLINFLGIKSSGVHLNCYNYSNGSIDIWVAQRGDILVDPNKYDSPVAGAVSFGNSLFDTVVKEAYEEASIPRELALSSLFQYSLDYYYSRGKNLSNDNMNVFELLLPEDFSLAVNDHEVAHFLLIPLEDLEDFLLKQVDNFKFNSYIAFWGFLYSRNMIKNKQAKKQIANLFNKIAKSEMCYKI